MPEVACLGVLVADILGRPVDAMPPRGRLGLVEQIALHIGGCAANTAVDLARLGVATAALGKVGVDGFGDFMYSAMTREGVDMRGVVRDETVSTSATMVLVSSDGERTFIHHFGGNGQYRLEDVAWDVIDPCKVLHIAGALIMPALDGLPMAKVLHDAREKGLITCLDTVWDATGGWMDTLSPCLPETDYFLPSLAEAQALTGRQDPREVAKALRDAGVKTVGLKLGEKGCYIQTAHGELTVPAYRVQAVDGTGSGDAWDAGCIVGLLHEWDLERTARFANAVGALCVTSLGTTTGVRSREETEEFIRRSAGGPGE